MTPLLRYDETCNRQNCGQRSTHRVSVRCGYAEVHFGMVVGDAYFGMVVCDACAPEIMLADLVPLSMWQDFKPILRSAGEPQPTVPGCRVHLTPLEGR